MNAKELYDGLRQTGTAEAKLVPIEAMAAKPKASAMEAVAALEAAGAPALTLSKARHLAEGKNIDDLMGKPPPNSAESKERRMAQEIAKAFKEEVLPRMLDKTAEKSPGQIVRPTA